MTCKIGGLPRSVAALLCAGLLSTGCISLLPSLKPGTSTDLDRIDRALAMNPANVHAWFLKGRARLELQEPAAAEECFRKAIALDPKFDEAHAGIGVSLMARHRWEDARKAYQDLLAISPDSVPGHEGLATVALQHKDLDSAAAQAAAALAVDPTAPQAHRVAGEVDYVRGNYQSAIDHWKQAMESPALAGELSPLVKDLEGYVKSHGAK